MTNEQDYVDLGLSCADICKALERGMDGKSLNELSKSVRGAINQLTTWVEVMIHVFCLSAYCDLQDRRRNSRGCFEMKWAGQGLSIPPLERRQRRDCSMEIGPG